MEVGTGSAKKKRLIGLLITALSLTAGAASAYSGQTYLISLVFGIVSGLITAVGYNLFAKTSRAWPVLSFYDVVSQIFIW